MTSLLCECEHERDEMCARVRELEREQDTVRALKAALETVKRERDEARAEVKRLREALAEIARPKRGGIEANDSDEDWIEYLRGALERERSTARAALAGEVKP